MFIILVLCILKLLT